MVPVPENVSARSVPGHGGRLGGLHHGHARLPQRVHQDEQLGADPAALQSVRSYKSGSISSEIDLVGRSFVGLISIRLILKESLVLS